jgi:hypothetical protein
MMSPFHSLTELLHTASALQRLHGQRKEQEALLGRVRPLLPPALAAHCVAALVKGERLVLFADSPVWSSRLRFCGGEVAAALLSQGLFRSPPKVEIRIHLAPSQPVADPAGRRPARLSARTARLLDETAAAVADPDLAAALRRLGRHR